jgi:hypothetical protein
MPLRRCLFKSLGHLSYLATSWRYPTDISMKALATLCIHIDTAQMVLSGVLQHELLAQADLRSIS